MTRTCSATLLALAVATAADSSYLVPVQPGVIVKPIASSGDLLPAGAVGTGTPSGGGATYAVPGLIDGLGVFSNGDGTFTLVANHEAASATNGGAPVGGTRGHEATAGAFVTRWTINQSTLKVTSLANQIDTVYSHAAGVWTNGTAVTIDRLCSADLPAPTALYNSGSGKGLPVATGRFFFSGEEGGSGRAFAHAVSGSHIGQSIMLPHLGRTAWENLVPCPAEQDLTIVAGLDDTGNDSATALGKGQIYFYLGAKATLGSANGHVQDWAAAAGLIGGTTYTVVANGQTHEQRTAAFGPIGVGAGKGTAVRFSLVQVDTPSNVATSASLDSISEFDTRTNAVGGTNFLRPEDGAWDPSNNRNFFFVTTDRFDTYKNGGSTGTATVGRSRLWRMTFDDIANPLNGGTLTMLIDGSENPGIQMMDNIAVDRFGRVLIQEDPGNAEHSASIWVYDTVSATMRKAAKFDPSRFGDLGYGSAGINGAKVSSVAPYDGDSAFTADTTVTGKSDEESSGIVDAQDILGPGWFLIGAQVHSITDMSLTSEIERGQMAAIYIPFTQVSGATYQAGNLAAITYGSGATKTTLPVRDGGLGSALAPVPGQPGQFWCLTDRGPNVAHPTDPLGKVFPAPAFSPNLRRVQLNGDGSMTVLEKLLLKRSDGTTAITGLPIPSGIGSTGESGYAMNNATGVIDATATLNDASGIDSEGLIAHPDGTFWISDEYGPFIARFSSTGTELQRFSPTTAATVNGVNLKLPAVLEKREPNRGMEGLTLTPDGTKLVGLMQSPLFNFPDTANNVSGTSRRTLVNRVVEITLASGAIRQFVYLNEKRQTANSEIIAVSNTKFLVLERDGDFPTLAGAVKKIYQIDLASATDIHDAADGATGKQYTATGGSIAGSLTSGIEDIVRAYCNVPTASPSIAQVTTALTAIGVTPVARTLAVDLAIYASVYNHDKPEGLALVGSKLYVINDDDFGVTDAGATTTTPVQPKIVLGSSTTQDLGATPTATTAGMQDYTQILELDLAALGSTISATNTTPTISVASTLAVAVAGTATTTVTVGDVETAAASLTVTASSAATGVATVAISGSGASRTLTVTGVANGTATITVTVTDAGGATTSATVAVTSGTGSASSGSAPAADNGSGCNAGGAAAGLLIALLGMIGLRRRN